MNRSIVRLFPIASLALAGNLAAQPPVGQFSLGGSVVNSRTGEPVKRALVLITGFGEAKGAGAGLAPPRQSPFTFSTFTDPGGAFRFNALPAATYILNAEKPGFTPERANGSGAPLILTDSIDNVKLGLSPLGIVTGKITDQDGQPLRMVNVLALKVDVQDGQRQSKQGRSVSTDDLGVYRMWNFAPGKYYIKAAGQGGGTYLYTGDTTPRLSSGDTFAPTYFGSGESLESATVIEIQPGSEIAADISLRSRPAHKIRGQVTNFIPHRTVRFELLSGDEDVAPSRVSVNGDTGRFEIQDVVSGNYVLRAIQGDTRGEAQLGVNNSDVSGLALPLAAGVDIAVNTQFTNSPPHPGVSLGTLGGRFRSTPGNCNVSLRPAGRRSGTTYNTGQPKPASLSGVLPGTYRVSVECYGAYPRSVLSGSLDLLANPIITIQPGSQPPSIEILATHGGGRITGNLDVKTSLLPDEGMILLVPQSGGDAKKFALYRQPGGTDPYPFEFDSLAPGAYLVWAFADGKSIEYRNPEWIRTLSGGTRVQVDENADASLTLTDYVK